MYTYMHVYCTLPEIMGEYGILYCTDLHALVGIASLIMQLAV